MSWSMDDDKLWWYKNNLSATFQNFGKDSYSFPSGIIWPDDCDSPFLSLKFYDPWSAEI